MLRNGLTVALRNLRREKGYAAINVLGLALGLACCLLIALFVGDELAHDRQHPAVDRLYRLTNHVTAAGDEMHIGISQAIYGPTAQEASPEVEAFVRLHPALERVLVRHGDARFFEERVFYADPSFFDLFGFPLRYGDPATALVEPLSVVLTPELAAKYFGEEGPLGQVLRVNEAYDFTVTGVLAEDPRRSHLQFDALFSIKTLEGLSGVWFYGVDDQFFNSWHLAASMTYVRLFGGADPTAVGVKLTEIVRGNVSPEGPQYVVGLQPVIGIYLHSDVMYEMGRTSDVVYVWVFIVVALFMLGIACINYMNLATARSLRRAVEVGIRKAVGAERGQLAGQFLAESAVTALAAFLLALLLAAAGTPMFNALTGKELPALSVFQPGLLAAALVVALGAGLVAGSYPALVLSGLPPVSMLRRSMGSGSGGAGLRRALVVTQFVATVVLLIGTATVHRQLAFFESKDLGFDREELVYFRIPDRSVPPRLEAVKERIAGHPGVSRVAVTSSVPTVGVQRHGVRYGDLADGENIFVVFYGVDHDFVETMDLQLVEGRSFSRAFASDSTEAFLLNETAVARFGWQDGPIGREFTWIDPNAGPQPGRVIGVVRDFHYETMRNAIEPAFFAVSPQWADVVVVRLRAGHHASALAHIERIWQDMLPAYPFEYVFLDESLGEAYTAERRFGQVFGLFTLLTMLVACMGLFGLVAFTAQQRGREVGVRKVLGASTASLVALLSKDFLKLVGVAFVIAAPLAYWVMSRWLEGFAYRIELGPAIFLGAGLAVATVALATVSGQALRAATADPVKAIRAE
jgi:putative ABC transport system permease protein